MKWGCESKLIYPWCFISAVYDMGNQVAFDIKIEVASIIFCLDESFSANVGRSRNPPSTVRMRPLLATGV